MAWWRVNNAPMAWPVHEGHAPVAAPTAAPGPPGDLGGSLAAPDKLYAAPPPTHAIPHAAALRNARLALARLTESIQSIAHPSAQDAPLLPKAYPSDHQPLLLSVENEAKLLHYLLQAAMQDGRALGITPPPGLPRPDDQQEQTDRAASSSSSSMASSSSDYDRQQLTNGSLIPCLLPIADALRAAYPSITEDVPPLGPSFPPGSAPWPCVLLVIRNPETAIQAVARARAAMLGVVLVRTALQALNDITEGLSSVTGYQAVVTEAHFPYMGGLELVTRLRRDGGPEWRTKPIILVRGEHPDQTLMPEASRRVGASEFVDSFQAIHFAALRATILWQSGYHQPPFSLPSAPCGGPPQQQHVFDMTANGGQPLPPPLPFPPALRRSTSSSLSASSASSSCGGHYLADESAPLVPLEEEMEDMAYDSGSDNGKGSKRVKRACSYCHTKKVLCSGERPCTRCTSLNICCTEYMPKPRLGKRQAPRQCQPMGLPHSSSVPPQAVASSTFQPSAATSSSRAALPPWTPQDAPPGTTKGSIKAPRQIHRSHPAHLPSAPPPAPHQPINNNKPPQQQQQQHGRGAGDLEDPAPAPAPLRIMLPPAGPATTSPMDSPPQLADGRRPPPPQQQHARPHTCARPVPSMPEMEQGLDRLGLTERSDDPSITYLRNFLLSNPDLYTAYVSAHQQGVAPTYPPHLFQGHALPMMGGGPVLASAYDGPPGHHLIMPPGAAHPAEPPPWPPHQHQQQQAAMAPPACDPRDAAPCWRPQLTVRSTRGAFTHHGGAAEVAGVGRGGAPPAMGTGGGGPGSSI